MKYNFIKNNESLINKILSLNNITKEDLDIEKYNNLIIDPKIDEFKETLLSLKDKRFLIVGDADCDGICATTIMKRLLDYLNIENNYYIPSRIDEGFGINNQIVELAHKHNYDCILALDNGIANLEIMNLCKDYNINYLIIDHHEYNQEPIALSYIHPNILIEDYSKLSAGGLCALLSSYFYDDKYNIVLGGLACLADMVGVLKYNRYLIVKMLEILNTNNIYQINYLSDKTQYTYNDISFTVIPKINTFNRLGLNTNLLVKYLLGDNEYCKTNYLSINDYNKQRKELTNIMANKSLEIIDNTKDIVVVKDESFKEGLCGLIANKLLNEYKKPIIVLSIVEDLIKGSARSLKDFDIYEYLKGFNKYESFGGHNQALGLSIRKQDYDEFIEYIDNIKIEVKEYIEDLIVLNDDELNIDSYYALESLRPFGIDFKEPRFVIDNPNITEMKLMANKYPKFIIDDLCSAISFNSEYAYKSFDKMIGKLSIDKFVNNKLSFVIEELL